MDQYKKIMHGSTSAVYINGERDVLATKIEVKMTGDFEDMAFCGEDASFPDTIQQNFSSLFTPFFPSTTAIPLRGPSPTGNRTAGWSWPLRMATARALCLTSSL